MILSNLDRGDEQDKVAGLKPGRKGAGRWAVKSCPDRNAGRDGLQRYAFGGGPALDVTRRSLRVGEHDARLRKRIAHERLEMGQQAAPEDPRTTKRDEIM